MIFFSNFRNSESDPYLLFIKEKYSNKPIDSKYYEAITIKKDENE
jgi:hypothetical protein